MGKKSKRKTRRKRQAKNAAKKRGKKISLKTASKIVQESDRTGVDVPAIVDSVVSGIPIVGPLASELLTQTGALGGIQDLVSGGMGGTSGRGGTRGVSLVDSKLGNLGVISRKKALQVLMSRGKRPPRRQKPTFIQVPSGQSVVRV